MRSRAGASAAVLTRCLTRDDQPWLGQALFSEYEEKMADAELWAGLPVTRQERETILDGFCAVARWQTVWFLWRPNLPDPDDDQIYELALAASVDRLVTHNTADFAAGQILFPRPRIVTPGEHLQTL